MTAVKPNLIKTVKNRIDVAFLPALLRPGALAGRTVVVTDVLRATTTIINALSNGCRAVIPAGSIDSARELNEQHAGSLLGGERGGKIVEGFHNGNSPVEYTPELIADKTLILATTNGTVAMQHCRTAKKILIGAMVNIGAVVETLGEKEETTIVCSGTDGFVTSEDVLFAGALIERLQQSKKIDGSVGELSDLAIIALNHWQNTCRCLTEKNSLADIFRVARGGINLVKIGHDADIVFAAKLDTVPVVPVLDTNDWVIR